jgi:AraC-like DNA-binding protein
MRYIEHKIASPDNIIIKSFYWLECDKIEQFQFFLPDGNPELMVSDFPISVLSTSKSTIKTGSCLFWGQYRFPGYITCSQSYKMFGIKFQPWVLRLITNSRYPLLVDRIVSGNLVFSPTIIKYIHGLIKNNDFKKSLFHIEEELSDLLVKKILNECEEQESLIEAVLKLKMSPELKVSELLPFYNKSLRTLENQFQNNIGVSPKQYQKIVRLRNVSEKIKNGKRIVHAVLDSGYYDQSHFNRDFKYSTLKNPSQFLWEENLILSTL